MTIIDLINKKATLIRNSKGIGQIELKYNDKGNLSELHFYYPDAKAPKIVLASNAKQILSNESIHWEETGISSTTKSKSKK